MGIGKPIGCKSQTNLRNDERCNTCIRTLMCHTDQQINFEI